MYDGGKKTKVYIGRYPSEAFRIKNAAVYIRISTTWDKQTGSMDNQISKLVDYVNHEPALRLRGVYVDIGSGRTAESRKELKRLLENCKSGEVEAIVTKSVSRFGRNIVDTLTICRQLKALKVDVYFDSESIHSIGSDGELSLSLASAISEAVFRSGCDGQYRSSDPLWYGGGYYLPERAQAQQSHH